jgi:hypothetical protein
MRFLSRDQSVSRISEVDLHRHPITRSPPRRPPGRYRDLMLCVVFSGGEGLRIIGEVQVRRRRALRMWKRLIPTPISGGVVEHRRGVIRRPKSCKSSGDPGAGARRSLLFYRH